MAILKSFLPGAIAVPANSSFYQCEVVTHESSHGMLVPFAEDFGSGKGLPSEEFIHGRSGRLMRL